MGYEKYKKLREFIIAKKQRQIVCFITKYLPLLCYVAYPIGILAVAITKKELLLRFVLVPLSAFVFCTLLRWLINCPRPYEVFPLPSLCGKDKNGQSFPSRHCVSASVIALALWQISLPLGICFSAVAVFIAISRVLSGVHFIKDVTTGVLLGAVFGIIGFFVI